MSLRQATVGAAAIPQAVKVTTAVLAKAPVLLTASSGQGLALEGRSVPAEPWVVITIVPPDAHCVGRVARQRGLGLEIHPSLPTLPTEGLAHPTMHGLRRPCHRSSPGVVRERITAANPVIATQAPKVSAPPVEMHASTEQQLEDL